MKANCVYSEQVKNIALLFQSDSIRMVFCKEAYTHTYDAANFFIVYDAFASFSYALRTYDYVSHLPAPKVVGPANPVVIAPPPPRPGAVPVYPAWDYPDTVRTTTSKGCGGPVIAEILFKPIGENVFKQPTDESKLVAIENASAGNCLSMTHVMKLTSLITSEDIRLRALKSCFPRVYDQDHYPYAAAAFAGQPMKDQWMAYARIYLTPPPAPCLVTDQDFQPLLQQIKDKRFASDQMALVTLLSKDRCFNVAQIKSISEVFAFGDDKMKLFKMCYAKCPDQNNYYQLVDELAFSSEKDELRRFINAGGK